MYTKDNIKNFQDMPEVQKNRWKIFISVSLFTFMATLDGSIVNIALPTIADSLNVPMNKSIWIVAVYMISICTFLVLFGKIGDIAGKIKVFRIGTLIFVSGTFLAGLANSLDTLVAARVVQALGASMTMSTNLGIITEIFKPQERGKALGFIGSVVSLGSITGPSVGGIIVHYLPWSYIFWLNIPFGLLTLFLGVKYLPKDVSKTKSSIDFVGFFIYAAAITLFFGSMFMGQEVGFGNTMIQILLTLSLALAILFIKYEYGKNSPLIEFAIFKNKAVTVGLICALIVFGANFFFAILMPFYLQTARGYTPSAAGFIMMAFPIVMVVAAPIAGSLAYKLGAGKLTILGLSLIALVNFLFIFIKIDMNIAYFITLVGLIGLGNAIFQSPNNTIIMSSVDKKYLGVLGSLNALARNVGNIVGVTFATTILFAAMSFKAKEHISTYVRGEEELFMFGMHITFAVSLIFMAIALLISIAQFKNSKPK
ncbi:MAG: MFS transporter [Campylobacteraceae bacterium]|jgi:EmrB/QacA subfamily drug resistance transporter|nr:MFS transporter [Campylobacteraceae bacterium]